MKIILALWYSRIFYLLIIKCVNANGASVINYIYVSNDIKLNTVKQLYTMIFALNKPSLCFSFDIINIVILVIYINWNNCIPSYCFQCVQIDKHKYGAGL